MTIISHSEEETMQEGRRLAKTLTPGSVVAINGSLGAGKTAFVRGIAEGLGISHAVTSPTFTIVNEYPGAMQLFHFDMYRMADENELFEIGWDDYIAQGGICAVEWSDRIPNALPPGTITVAIENTGGDSRRLEIDINW